jgi:hypothetical protein
MFDDQVFSAAVMTQATSLVIDILENLGTTR